MWRAEVGQGLLTPLKKKKAGREYEGNCGIIFIQREAKAGIYRVKQYLVWHGSWLGEHMSAYACPV